MKLGKQQLLGILFVNMGTLALEVVLTRIFSVMMWYHFAFLAISLALMGSATAGVLLYFFPRLSQPENAQRWMGYTAVALAVSVPVTFILYLQIPFEPVLMNRADWFSGGQIFWLALIYLDLAIPFFLAGIVMSLALSAWSEQAGRVYWADLTGASLGCLVSIAALEWLGGGGALLGIGVVMAVAGVILTNGWQPKRPLQAAPILGLLVVVGVFTTNQVEPWLKLTVNKAGGQEPTPVYEKWNANSRVTVYEPSGYPFFWAIDPDHWTQTLEQDMTFNHALLLIDAVAGTPIQNFNGNLEQVAFLRWDLTSLAYHLAEQPKTLVIGPGGGRDVLSALASGSQDVTAVEVNPAVINAVRGPFAEFAGNLYERPEVNVQVADARGFVERSSEQYDVIQASLIDTWAAGGSGAFALSENSLYTQEAFETYYQHLTDQGILTISRWYLPKRPAETLRLVSTGLAGWEAAGAADPSQHVAVVAHDQTGAQTEGLSTTLFKKRPFTPDEVADLQTIVAELGYTVIYAPGLEPLEEVGQFITGDRQTFIDQYPLDISPATDNRPFFFNLILLGDLLDPALSGSGVYRTSMEAIYILFAVIGISAVFATLFILAPLWLGTKRGNLARPSATLLGYIGALGLGFMLVEIPTIQKLTVYLGRPVYSLAVVLFSLLLFSGLGSLWSGRWPADRMAANLRKLFVVLVVVLILHPIISIWALKATLGFSLTLRLVIAVALLSILGFLMGIPFPTGIRWAGQKQTAVIPWLWGINGVMSVMGAALATTLAIHLGFQVTLFMAAGVYALAGVAVSREMA